VEKRRLRAREEGFRVSNSDTTHPIFSNFRVQSGSGLHYSVEIRSVGERQFSCTCVDFRINGLGTCKHVEAVLLQLERRFREPFKEAARDGSNRIEVVPDLEADTLRVAHPHGQMGKMRGSLLKWFREDGALRNGSPEAALTALEELKAGEFPEIRVSQEVKPWLENRQHALERKQLRHEFELKVQSGEWPPQETKVPLFP
jgi:hypothetical protein